MATPQDTDIPKETEFTRTTEAAAAPAKVQPDTETRDSAESILQRDSLRATYETFEDFRTTNVQLDRMLKDVLALHTEAIPEMRQILDEAVLLYPHPYQYHNAVHMLTTTCFAMDRAIRVNQMQREDDDIVDKVRNVVTMVGYHDTGNTTAPRGEGIDETEAVENLLKAIENSTENNPLHIYQNPEYLGQRNQVCGAILGSFFRDRFASFEAMKAEMEQGDPKTYGYIKKMASRLGFTPEQLFAMPLIVSADGNKYSALMKNADISSSLIGSRLKNLFLNQWEDLQRAINAIFIGRTGAEYAGGFEGFLTASYPGQNPDQDAVIAANDKRFAITVTGIQTDTDRDKKIFESAQAYMKEIQKKHGLFINLVFAEFNRATGNEPKRDIMRIPLTEVFHSLKSLREDEETLQAMFKRNSNRDDASAQTLAKTVASVPLDDYETRMREAGFSNLCWAQLTEENLCALLEEPYSGPVDFAETKDFPYQEDTSTVTRKRKNDK